jgi:RNA polymerase sigma factor (sigma-70 family)
VPEALHPRAERTVEETMVDREAVERLRTLFLQLETEERELLILRFVGELTFKEIGLVVGKSESGVYRQLRRILHRLKEQHRGG